MQHFYRTKSDGMHGIGKFMNCQHKKNIISLNYPHPLITNIIEDNAPYCKFYAGFNDLKQKHGYTAQKKSPQTGTLVLEVLKKYNYIDTNSNIFLVGFTSTYDHGLWDGHSKNLEDQYFKSQQEVYKGLIYFNDHLASESGGSDL